ncbi:MAG: hypothetical protein K5696_07380 [Lachnospiraceae bacterium]|nr:hypothetical protein [Lachnospiraceae bacterium]
MKEKNELAVDRVLRGFLADHLHTIILILLFVCSVLLRIRLAPETALSSDYELYIKGWPERYRELGFVRGMGEVIGDYYVPFNIMYAVIGLSPWEPWVLASVFSCIFDYLIAGVVFALARYLYEQRGDVLAVRKAAYLSALTCYLPVVFMNSALWKQCDGMYIFFALLAVYLILRDRATPAFAMLGISFSFKFQAVFFLPFFCLLYLLKKNFSILQFLWIPGIYFISGLPAVFCRRGLRATYGTYFMQMLEGTSAGTAATSEDYGMVANYPNLYNYGLDDYLTTMALPAALFTLMLLLVSVGAAWWKRDRLNDVKLLFLLAWQIWACNMFLPSMHERYDYGAVLLFALLVAMIPRESVIPAAVLNVGTYITYLRAAAVDIVSIHVLTAVYIAAFLWTSRELVRCLKKR